MSSRHIDITCDMISNNWNAVYEKLVSHFGQFRLLT